MKLYFFRHGQAEDAQMPDFDDFARRLTEKGEERTAAAGKAFVRLGIKPKRLYSSPRVRARQTADILAKALGMPVTVRDDVGFHFHLETLTELVADLGDDDEVLFVGHEPDFSATVSQLISGGEIVIKRGGLARVDVYERSPLKGALIWLLSAKLLEEIGQD